MTGESHATRIRALRERLEFTREDFAKLMGLPTDYLIDVECGDLVPDGSLAALFEAHLHEIPSQAWHSHVTKENGGRPYVINIRCSGHPVQQPRLGVEALERPPLVRATLFPMGWHFKPLHHGDMTSAKIRPNGDADREVLRDVSGRVGTSTGAWAPDSERESRPAIPPLADRPRRTWGASHTDDYYRFSFSCRRCRDSVPIRNSNDVEAILDELASRNIHAVNLDDLRTYLAALRRTSA
ncbi:helix-turn-helix domain-containing protein [Microbacterium caowuchunii]|uniref:Helix-turn-helix transcriptional regulator n=1 Tax=Microbacterium caowuchunii TaxID=2614638 RepID=A0A5N0TFA5_9MICO|nr:helix-turn-helix transcriptional regulator [Microbacterium caowuchunii]KAA9133710.1 helix-turn-helix transcriptional regulator [Microbacterium caowuchunii]